MSVIMVIIDGAVSKDYRFCTNINKASKKGYINNIPEGFESGSLACIMNILKVPPKFIPKGRAYLESLALDIPINSEDLIFRCNNIKLENQVLLGNENKNLNLKFEEGKLISINTYKNLLVLHNKKELIEKIKTFPPHEHFGEKIENIMPLCEDKNLEKFLRDLIIKYHVFPWGESIKNPLPPFEKKGAVVCSTEIVKGIAKALKMYCPPVKNTTSDIDTDLYEKTKMTLKLNKEYEFVLLHINGADECAHRRQEEEKVNFIKKIDKVVIQKLLENLKEDTSLIITSDHGTSAKTGAHLRNDVSYYVFNENEEAEIWLKR